MCQCFKCVPNVFLSLVFTGDNHATKEKWDFGDCDGFCVTKGWYVDASVDDDDMAP
jgi:hypothetical protein